MTQFKFRLKKNGPEYMIAWNKCNENNKPSTNIDASEELDDPISNTGC